MTKFKALGGAAAALAVATMAVPAQAQDRRSGGRDRDRHHHHHRDTDKVDGGGLVLGALLVGGLVALASGEKKRREKAAAAYEADYEAALPADGGAAVPVEGSAPVPDMPAPYAAEYDGLYDMEAATDRCASEAETFGQQFARMARVSSISSQVWNGKSFVIKGKLELAEGYADPGKLSRKFRCGLRAGSEPAITIEGFAAGA